MQTSYGQHARARDEGPFIPNPKLPTLHDVQFSHRPFDSNSHHPSDELRGGCHEASHLLTSCYMPQGVVLHPGKFPVPETVQSA